MVNLDVVIVLRCLVGTFDTRVMLVGVFCGLCSGSVRTIGGVLVLKVALKLRVTCFFANELGLAALERDLALCLVDRVVHDSKLLLEAFIPWENTLRRQRVQGVILHFWRDSADSAAPAWVLVVGHGLATLAEASVTKLMGR